MTLFREALEEAYLAKEPRDLKAIAGKYPVFEAAPKLLAACKDLLKSAPNWWVDDFERWPRIMDKIEAAIAEAEK